jgi:hypothetical protein
MAGMGRKRTLAFRCVLRRITRIGDAPNDAEKEPCPSRPRICRLEAGRENGDEAKETENVKSWRRALSGEFVGNPVPQSSESQFFAGLELAPPSSCDQEHRGQACDDDRKAVCQPNRPACPRAHKRGTQREYHDNRRPLGEPIQEYTYPHGRSYRLRPLCPQWVGSCQ